MAHELSFWLHFALFMGVNNYCNLVMIVICVPAHVDRSVVRLYKYN